MSPLANGSNDPSFALDHLPLHLPPALLKARLAGLIRASATQGAMTVAETVVRYFQALALHPQLVADLNERAAYCHGARHWRLLAAIGEQSAGRSAGRLSKGGA